MVSRRITRVALPLALALGLGGGVYLALGGGHAWRVFGARAGGSGAQVEREPVGAEREPAPVRGPVWRPKPLAFRAVSLAAAGDAAPATGAPTWSDIDGDGAPDLFVAGGEAGDCALFINRAGRLEPAPPGRLRLAAGARYHAGAFSDFDDDGDRDVYLAGIGTTPDELLRQLPDGSFEPATEEYGLVSPIQGRTRAALWSDLDGDGRLDLYVVRDGAPDRLAWRQAGATFLEVAAEAGLDGALDAHSVLIADLDGDGDLDLYSSRADPGLGDRQHFNRGDGTFVELPALPGLARARASRCAAQGDVDGDGMLDLFLAHAGGGASLLSAVEGEHARVDYEDHSTRAGLELPGLVIDSARFCDLDLDGALDLLALGPRGLTLHRNRGDGSFADETAAAGLSGYGAGGGRTFALADYDRDGDVDIALSGGGDGVLLLENQASGASWLRLRAPGRPGNSDGLGAQVRISLPDGRRLRRTIQPGPDEPALTIGLGGAAQVEDLYVVWSDGGRARSQGVPAGIEFVLGESSAPALVSSHPAALLGEVQSFNLERTLLRAAELLGTRLPPIDPAEVKARQLGLDAWIESRPMQPPGEERRAAASARIGEEARLELAGRVLAQRLRIPSEEIDAHVAARALEWQRPARLAGRAFYFTEAASAERARSELATGSNLAGSIAALAILPIEPALPIETGGLPIETGGLPIEVAGLPLETPGPDASAVMHSFVLDAPTWARLRRDEVAPFEQGALPKPGALSTVFRRGDGFGLLLVEKVLPPVPLPEREARARAEAQLQRRGARRELDRLLGLAPRPATPGAAVGARPRH